RLFYRTGGKFGRFTELGESSPILPNWGKVRSLYRTDRPQSGIVPQSLCDKKAERQFISLQSEAGDSPFGFRGNVGEATEFFACMDIADMHFDDGRLDGGDRIADGYRGMGIAAGIQEDAVGRESGPLQLVDQFAFDIALKIAEGDGGIFFLQLRKVLIEGLTAINLRLARPKQIQIRPVDDGDVHGTRGYF